MDQPKSASGTPDDAPPADERSGTTDAPDGATRDHEAAEAPESTDQSHEAAVAPEGSPQVEGTVEVRDPASGATGEVAPHSAAPHSPASHTPAIAAASATPPDRRLRATILAFAVALVATLAAYVAINGASLRTSGEPRTYDISKMTVPRGTATRDGDVLVAKTPGADVLIVALRTDFRARELSAVAWDATDIPPDADVRLLFNSDYRPRVVQNRVLAVEDGRVQPISMTGDPDWLGTITGLALAVRAPGATIRVRGVTAKPNTASQLVGDRVREWLRFEPWGGTSINEITGGAQAQRLPLPLVVVVAALLAFGALALVRRLAPSRLPGTLATLAAGVFVVAWAVLDARWTANLARQNVQTIERYAGKDAAGRARAAEDGDLYRFIEKARAAMPADPQRVLVLSAAHYHRGRAGWHLLPHRAMWLPAIDAAPQAGTLRTGDYLLVWHDTHARFDPSSGRLVFDNGVTLPAKPVFAEGAGAVYAIL